MWSCLARAVTTTKTWVGDTKSIGWLKPVYDWISFIGKVGTRVCSPILHVSMTHDITFIAVTFDRFRICVVVSIYWICWRWWIVGVFWQTPPNAARRFLIRREQRGPLTWHSALRTYPWWLGVFFAWWNVDVGPLSPRGNRFRPWAQKPIFASAWPSWITWAFYRKDIVVCDLSKWHIRRCFFAHRYGCSVSHTITGVLLVTPSRVFP